MIYMKRKYIDISFYFAKYPVLKKYVNNGFNFLEWGENKSLAMYTKESWLFVAAVSSRAFSAL